MRSTSNNFNKKVLTLKEGSYDGAKSVNKWRENFLRDWQARMDRCARANSSNPAPTMSITSPANGATYAAPASVGISVSASDGNGTVSKVEFFHGSTSLIAADTTSPYAATWNSFAAGSYTLTARATDNGGASATSSGVNITVIGTSSGTGGTVTLLPIADTYVRDGTSASSNFGTSTTLQTKLENASYNRQSFLKFNISGVSGTVTSAKLRLYGKSSSTSGGSA